nr:uncharacterized mitochondrial protein AtMg00810-like [Tanacetum cinerariifolium]
MVWSGYAILMPEKTDLIKLKNISGCLPGSTFVYNEVFKLHFSSASLHHSISCTLMCPHNPLSFWYGCEILFIISSSLTFTNGEILLHYSLVWCLNLGYDRTIWQPGGFVDPDFLDHAYKLKKALYSLKQAPRAWFINHPYTLELLKKYGMDGCNSISTPMPTARLDTDLQGTLTNQTKYRSMIKGLMYLTASRPDIAFSTFVYACYQARPTVIHLKEKIDLINPPCPPSSKIIREILRRHPLYYALTTYASIPLIYMKHMWITLKLADSKKVFRFMVDEEEVTFLLDKLRAVLKLPHATANNNVEFVKPLELSVMLEFLDIIGHAKQICLVVLLYIKNLPQPWQTLVKILMRCLTTKVTGIDQPPLHMMQMFCCVVNNVPLDYITIPMTQLQPNESYQGINKTLSTARSPNPQKQQQGESSTPKKPIIIMIPKRKQHHLKTLILTVAYIDLENLNEAQVLSYALAKSVEEYEAQQNVKRVEENLLDEDVNKLVEGEESDANQFANDMVLSQEISTVR